MLHVDEHTLDLYALGAEEVIAHRGRIEGHLRECVGCRERVAGLVAMYDATKRSLEAEPPPAFEPKHALALRKAHGNLLYEPMKGLVVPERRKPLQRIQLVFRQHPVASVVGGGALLLGIFTWTATDVLRPGRDVAPAYVVKNEILGSVDIYNRKNEKLWFIPVSDIKTLEKTELYTGKKSTQIADLDGDGKPEVLTSLPLAGESEDGNRSLKILRQDNIVIRTIRFGESLQCRGRLYPDDFSFQWFGTIPSSKVGSRDILIASSSSHSPSIIARFDAFGTLIGTYRHFGHMLGTGQIPLVPDSRTGILLFGFSDVEEGASRLAVIVGLDPTLIIGDGESSWAGGFGLPHSPAEKYYLTIPAADVFQKLGRDLNLGPVTPINLLDGPGFMIDAYYSGFSPPPAFQYYFGKDMRVVVVKSSDVAKRIVDDAMHKVGTKEDFYTSYLDRLRHDVKYWNGRTWCDTVATVVP